MCVLRRRRRFRQQQPDQQSEPGLEGLLSARSPSAVRGAGPGIRHPGGNAGPPGRASVPGSNLVPRAPLGDSAGHPAGGLYHGGVPLRGLLQPLLPRREIHRPGPANLRDLLHPGPVRGGDAGSQSGRPHHAQSPGADSRGPPAGGGRRAQPAGAPGRGYRSRIREPVVAMVSRLERRRRDPRAHPGDFDVSPAQLPVRGVRVTGTGSREAGRIVVDGVWKKFQRGERHDSLRDLIPNTVGRLLGRRRDPLALRTNDFWALKNIGFEVLPGQALGIIGHNGAGKSTLLKLLTRILRPTLGRIQTRGRIGALIEIAAGFHPDLTGRENVFLQGAIMGMPAATIRRRFDEIVEFSGITTFIDTPVKRYSSGMNARLGFSIAAHLEPDVLLIDEVLAVGDMAFQAKCVERMHQFKRQGVAIVFVSHNLQAVAGLCERAVYLQRSVRALGPSLDVIEEYVRTTDKHQEAALRGAVEILSTELFDQNGRPAAVVDPGAALPLRVTYKANTTPGPDLLFGFLAFRSTDRLCVYDANFSGDELALPPLAAGETVVVNFRFNAHLTRGQYHLGCHVFDVRDQEYTSRVCPAGVFTVRESRT